jgi:hypothetical protein
LAIVFGFQDDRPITAISDNSSAVRRARSLFIAGAANAPLEHTFIAPRSPGDHDSCGLCRKTAMPLSQLKQRLRRLGLAPLVAAGFVVGVLGVSILYQATIALSSTVAESDAQVPGPPIPNSCDQQTWPYIEQRCGSGAPTAGKRVTRIISPEHAPTQEIVALSPVAQVFADLSTKPTSGVAQQEFTPIDQIPVVMDQNKTAPRSTYVVPTPRRAERINHVKVGVHERRPSIRQADRQDQIASAYAAEAPRVRFSPPDVAHGLY